MYRWSTPKVRVMHMHVWALDLYKSTRRSKIHFIKASIREQYDASTNNPTFGIRYFTNLLHIFAPQRYQYFSQRGIPTPPFRFFFGHLKTLWNVPSPHRQFESWTKEYGKIYGIYEGTLPIFVVSDPDFLQEAFIKQFSVFHARKKNNIR